MASAKSTGFQGLSSHKEDTEGDMNVPYLANFIHTVANLPPEQKIAQIGIEPSVLGIPRGGAAYEKCRSIFSDVPFENWDTSRIPSAWTQFDRIQPTVALVGSFPDLTLFYIFYAQPRDLAQIAAAEELQNRGWKYISDRSVWRHVSGGVTLEFDVHEWTIRPIPQK